MSTWTRRVITWLAVSAATVTASVAVTAPPAAADVDVYTTPDWHRINGRDWSTTCERYSSTITRCRTNILAQTVVYSRGRYVATTGWVFNNLTYFGADRASWGSNPLGRTTYWSSGGREWRTECDTPVTGRNGCRTYAKADVVSSKLNSRGQRIYFTLRGVWVFNNLVRFGTTPPVKPTPSPSPTAPVGPYDARVGIDSQAVFAKSLVDWVNKARVDTGPEVNYGTDGKAIPYLPELDAEALRCAESNVANGSLSHSLPGCVAADGIYRENLASGVKGVSNASGTVQLWMASPGHRVTVLSPLSIGMGAAYACNPTWCVVVLKTTSDWSLYPSRSN